MSGLKKIVTGYVTLSKIFGVSVTPELKWLLRFQKKDDVFTRAMYDFKHKHVKITIEEIEEAQP
jgi:hypothetical protein